jgi:hypothetical protein
MRFLRELTQRPTRSASSRAASPFGFGLALLLLLSLPVPPVAAQDQIPDLGQTVTGDLRLSSAIWARYEGGPGIPQPHEFDPGDMVAFRARIAGFRIAEVDFRRFRVFLSYEVAAFDFRGIPIGDPRKDIINESVEVEDKQWQPVVEHDFFLPPLAEYGDYEVRIKVRDEISQRQQAFIQKFRVNGKRLPQLDEATVINFGFYRRPSDSSAMPEGVYRAGNTLWAKFDVAGFKIAEQNRFHVACDVEVRDAEGNVLFTQPDALEESASPEYPRRFVPGEFSLQIQPGTAKAQYAVAVIARDLIADTTTEHVFPFVVE